MYEALYYLEPLWKKIALVYGLGENDLGYYLLEEAEFLFSKNKKVKDSEIEKRKKGFGLLLHDDKLALITGKALDKKKYLLNEESDGDFIFTQALSIK